MLFGNDPEDRSVAEHDRTVVETIADGNRCSPRRPVAAGRLSRGRSAAMALRAAFQEHRLAEEVGARVAGDAKLGKNDQIAIGRQAHERG